MALKTNPKIYKHRENSRYEIRQDKYDELAYWYLILGSRREAEMKVWGEEVDKRQHYFIYRYSKRFREHVINWIRRFMEAGMPIDPQKIIENMNEIVEIGIEKAKDANPKEYAAIAKTILAIAEVIGGNWGGLNTEVKESQDDFIGFSGQLRAGMRPVLLTDGGDGNASEVEETTQSDGDSGASSRKVIQEK